MNGRYAFTSACYAPPVHSTAIPSPPKAPSEPVRYVDRRRQRLPGPSSPAPPSPFSPAGGTSADPFGPDGPLTPPPAGWGRSPAGSFAARPGYCPQCALKDLEAEALRQELMAVRRRHQEVLTVLRRLHPDLRLPTDRPISLPGVAALEGRSRPEPSEVVQAVAAKFIAHWGDGEVPSHLALGILGLEGPAKSQALAIVRGEQRSVLATQGVATSSYPVGALTLDVRDFGGDRRFRGVWPAYYNTVHGLVFVVGLFDEQCLAEACELLWWVLGDTRTVAKPLLVLAFTEGVAAVPTAREVAVLLRLPEVKVHHVELCAPQHLARSVTQGLEWLASHVGRHWAAVQAPAETARGRPRSSSKPVVVPMDAMASSPPTVGGSTPRCSDTPPAAPPPTADDGRGVAATEHLGRGMSVPDGVESQPMPTSRELREEEVAEKDGGEKPDVVGKDESEKQKRVEGGERQEGAAAVEDGELEPQKETKEGTGEGATDAVEVRDEEGPAKGEDGAAERREGPDGPPTPPDGGLAAPVSAGVDATGLPVEVAEASLDSLLRPLHNVLSDATSASLSVGMAMSGRGDVGRTESPLLNGRENERAVAVLGLRGAGKSSLVRLLAGGPDDDRMPTAGYTAHPCPGPVPQVVLYDFVGAAKAWQQHLAEMFGFIFVVDCADPDSVEDAQEALQAIVRHPYVHGKPLLVFANKQDVPGALSEPELAAALQLQHEPRLCCPASADSPEDAQRGLRWMVDHVQNVPPEVMDRVHRESLEEMSSAIRKIRKDLTRHQSNGTDASTLDRSSFSSDPSEDAVLTPSSPARDPAAAPSVTVVVSPAPAPPEADDACPVVLKVVVEPPTPASAGPARSPVPQAAIPSEAEDEVETTAPPRDPPPISEEVTVAPAGVAREGSEPAGEHRAVGRPEVVAVGDAAKAAAEGPEDTGPPPPAAGDESTPAGDQTDRDGAGEEAAAHSITEVTPDVADQPGPPTPAPETAPTIRVTEAGEGNAAAPLTEDSNEAASTSLGEATESAAQACVAEPTETPAPATATVVVATTAEAMAAEATAGAAGGCLLPTQAEDSPAAEAEPAAAVGDAAAKVGEARGEAAAAPPPEEVFSPRNYSKATIAFFGLDNAGKTTVISAMTGQPDPEAVPTVGFSPSTFLFKDTQLQVYDLGGSRTFRDIWREYYAELHAIVFVVDASDPARLEEARGALQRLREDRRARGKPLLVLANKQDSPGAKSADEVATELAVPGEERYCAVGCTALGSPTDPAIDKGILFLLREVDSQPHLMERVRQEEAQDVLRRKAEQAERARRVREWREAEAAREAAQAAPAGEAPPEQPKEPPKKLMEKPAEPARAGETLAKEEPTAKEEPVVEEAKVSGEEAALPADSAASPPPAEAPGPAEAGAERAAKVPPLAAAVPAEATQAEAAAEATQAEAGAEVTQTEVGAEITTEAGAEATQTEAAAEATQTEAAAEATMAEAPAVAVATQAAAPAEAAPGEGEEEYSSDSDMDVDGSSSSSSSSGSSDSSSSSSSSSSDS